jgi:hypothetical protein
MQLMGETSPVIVISFIKKRGEGGNPAITTRNINRFLLSEEITPHRGIEYNTRNNTRNNTPLSRDNSNQLLFLTLAAASISMRSPLLSMTKDPINALPTSLTHIKDAFSSKLN